MQIIQYNLIEADIAGIKISPSIQIEKLGMTILLYGPTLSFDEIFMFVSNVPDKLPSYITIANYEYSEKTNTITIMANNSVHSVTVKGKVTFDEN